MDDHGQGCQKDVQRGTGTISKIEKKGRPRMPKDVQRGIGIVVGIEKKRLRAGQAQLHHRPSLD